MAIKANGFFAPERRVFLAVQGAKAAVGAALTLGFVLWVGRPDGAEALAMAGLLAPAGLALLGLAGLPLAALEQAGLGLFALLIGYLAALTGGMVSPLAVWFVLVPAEAALAGGADTSRRAVLGAGLTAGAALLAVAVAQAFHLLPPSRLAGWTAQVGPLWQIYALSLLLALGQALLIAAAAQDRQKAADRAAAEGAAMYRFLADNAMDLITRHSSDGRICFASPAAFALLGYGPDELEGLAPAALVHPDDLKALQAAFTAAAYFGRNASAQVRLRHRDGSHAWVEMRCRPTEGGDIVVVTRDIAERKSHERALIEARDAAESASRAKTAFLANMSHELRTPLNAIIGFSEVMAREIFGPVGSSRYQEYARLIHESGGHLLDLINGVLDMSKIEAGKFEIHAEAFDLGEVAGGVIGLLAQAAEQKGVTLTLAIAPSAAAIFADKRAVKQMLVNLLSNGVKFTPRGGTVGIAAHAGKGGVVITVRDTGTGIARSDMEKLGQPFVQVEGAQHRAKEGTGLGLALVKSLAALHGGEAVLQSALGEGTCVTLRLPQGAIQGAANAPAAGQFLPFRGAA